MRNKNLAELIPSIVIGVMGNSVIYLVPLLIGAMVNDRGFTEQEAGLMASADLAGFAAATLATALLLKRGGWRRMALAGAILMVAANVGTTFVYSRELFALIRFASGMGGGVLVAIATVELGRTANPDRSYGLLFAAVLLFASAGLWGLPLLLAHYGLNGAYWAIGLLALLTALFAARLPEPANTTSEPVARLERVRWLPAGLVLISIVLFFTEQNAVYSYYERIGNAAGLSPDYIGFSLGAGNLAGFAGAMLVVWLGDRFGRLIPLVLATLLQGLCFALVARHVTAPLYLGVIAMLALVWNAMNPFQLGILAHIDPGGRALALSATVMGIGLALGPAASALVMGIGGLTAILWLAAALAAASLAAILGALSCRL